MRLRPFLLFDGDCAEAMAFYQSCLGGELAVTRVEDTPTGQGLSEDQRRRVAYAELKSGPVELSATDWRHPTRRPKPGNTVALYISGASYEALRTLFDRLSEGADPALLDPLSEAPFGTYGHLADRYGVHWFFQGEARAQA